MYTLTSAHILIFKIAPQLNLRFILAKLIVHLFECSYLLYVSLTPNSWIKTFFNQSQQLYIYTLLTVIGWELFTRSNNSDDTSFQSALLITLLVSVMKILQICYVKARSLGKSQVFLRKSNHPGLACLSASFLCFK